VYVFLWACVHYYVFIVCLDVDSNPLSGHCMFSYDQCTYETCSRKGDVCSVRRLWDNSTSPARMITVYLSDQSKTGQSLNKMSKPTALHTSDTAQVSEWLNISDTAKKLY